MLAAVAAATALAIVASPGNGGAAKHWTLRCAPVGGTLPKAAQACTKLAAAGNWWAQTPPGTMCSDIYGGPQTARVAGTYRGRRISTRFARRNGCETARWNRVSFLLVTR